MKKIITILMMLMLSSMVLAQGNAIDMKSNIAKPKGLENAMIQVKNENALQRLEQNLNRFQEQHQERLAFCQEECEIELDLDEANQTQIRAKQKVKFLGLFEGDAEETFTTDEEGNILAQERNIWRRLLQMGWVKQVEAKEGN